ncbi:MAG: hypothetical protein H6578_03425 [Chitinophagales bacterium]|nr:hypothetical protein [Chitinophagales bacterium]
MKNTFILKLFIMIFAISTVSVNTVYAKSDKKKAKKEKKAVKKQLKKYMKDTESYSNMINGYKENVSELEEDVNELSTAKRELSTENEELKSEMVQLNNQVSDLTYNLEEAQKKSSSIFKNEGIEYRVQIGAYRNFDFTPYLTENQIIGHEFIDGVHRYFVGSWANADDAYNFAQKFNEMEIDDAFVTKYVDGTRVDFDYHKQ